MGKPGRQPSGTDRCSLCPAISLSRPDINVGTDKRITLKDTLARELTTEPVAPAPSLVCPDCDVVLRYLRSYIGGVNPRNVEQWDYYACRCGEFQYRHRTRRIRKVS